MLHIQWQTSRIDTQTVISHSLNYVTHEHWPGMTLLYEILNQQNI